jgi:hypothetical protein
MIELDVLVEPLPRGSVVRTGGRSLRVLGWSIARQSTLSRSPRHSDDRRRLSKTNPGGLSEGKRVPRPKHSFVPLAHTGIALDPKSPVRRLAIPNSLIMTPAREDASRSYVQEPARQTVGEPRVRPTLSVAAELASFAGCRPDAYDADRVILWIQDR